MTSYYWEKTIHRLNEAQLQDLLTEVYESDGWDVKNMHRIDPRSENGADLELRKGQEKILIAVKEKPRSKDIEQLRKLGERKTEAKLVYAYSKPSTGGFAKVEDELNHNINFLHGKTLNDFLLEGKSISYLLSIFEVHPIILEYSYALSIVWECRHVNIPKKSTRNDMGNIYTLKQAVLKKRAAVSVFALKYDKYVNSFTAKDSKTFPGILDDVLGNLDLVQRFAGISLIDAFSDISRTTPHLLARLWNLVSQRSYWKQYTHETEKFSNVDEVREYTSKYWVLPSAGAIGEAKNLSGNAIGFLSGVRDILESLTRSLRDLDVAIDSVWDHRYAQF